MLLSDGLRGAGDIKLKDVCERLERRKGIRITPGSVYERIWADQRDFQLEVIATVLQEYDASGITRALEHSRTGLERFDLDDPYQRRKAKRWFCHNTATQLVSGILESRHWQIWVGIWGAIASSPDLRDDKRIGGVIESGYEYVTQLLADACGQTMRQLGYRLRDGLTDYQLAVALGSITEGLALRLRYDTDHERELTTRHTGIEVEWGMPGLCFESIVDAFYEPLDDR